MPIVHDPKTGQFSGNGGGSGSEVKGGRHVVVANIHMGMPKFIVQQGRGSNLYAGHGTSPVTGKEVVAIGKGRKGAEVAWLKASARHAAQHMTPENKARVTARIEAGLRGLE